MDEDELRGEHYAKHSERAHEDAYDREEVGDVLVCPFLPALLLNRKVHWQKGRHDHAADDKLIKLVRQVVRHGIAAGQQGGAQRIGLRPCTEETSNAAEDYQHAHHCGRATDGYLRLLLIVLFLFHVGLSVLTNGPYFMPTTPCEGKRH